MEETSGRGRPAGVLGEEERSNRPIRYSRHQTVMTDRHVLGETSEVLLRRGKSPVLPYAGHLSG
jgi:hypothetical protein